MDNTSEKHLFLGVKQVPKNIFDTYDETTKKKYIWFVRESINTYGIYFGDRRFANDGFTKGEVEALLSTKQNVLTAGSNITINGNVISANSTNYSGGTNIEISGNVIYALGYIYDPDHDSLSFGHDTVALDEKAAAFGYKSMAIGANSHAEGGGLYDGIDYAGGIAYGLASHAEGGSLMYTAEFTYDSQNNYYTFTPDYSSITRDAISFLCREGNVVFNTDKGNYAFYFITNSTITDNEVILYLEDGPFDDFSGLIVLGAAMSAGSHVEGAMNICMQVCSHAEGALNKVFGQFSHAEGVFNSAYGDYSHAEGSFSIAKGNESHSEGSETQAVGECTHAEGIFSCANGNYSHAEGYNSYADGTSSHAEGDETSANGSASHAEGSYTIASGESAHAEGSYTTAYTNYSHAEGRYTQTLNQSEHAEGSYNVSHSGTSAYGSSANTQHSVGIGVDDSERLNAFEIMQNGDVYVYGIGGYTGTSISGVTTLQNEIENIEFVTSSHINDLTNRVSNVESGKQDKLSAGTNVSISSSNVISVDLSNYYTSAQTDNKISQLIDDNNVSGTTTYSSKKITEILADVGFNTEIVNTLPSTGNTKTIYLKASTSSQTQNVYDEYLYINSTWEKIGTTEVDLTNYYTTAQTDSLLTNYYTTAQTDTLLTNYYTTAQTNTLLDKYYTSAQTDTLLTNYYTTAQTDTLLDKYYTSAQTDTLLSNYYTTAQTDTFLSGKQDALSAGTNIEISGNVISAEGYVYDSLFNRFAISSNVSITGNTTISGNTTIKKSLTVNSGATIDGTAKAKVNGVSNVELGVPIGSVIMWVGGSFAPYGWLICNGDRIMLKNGSSIIQTIQGKTFTPGELDRLIAALQSNSTTPYGSFTIAHSETYGYVKNGSWDNTEHTVFTVDSSDGWTSNVLEAKKLYSVGSNPKFYMDTVITIGGLMGGNVEITEDPINSGTEQSTLIEITDMETYYTFSLPNLVQRFPMGATTGTTSTIGPNNYNTSIGKEGGEAGHILKVEEMPQHQHQLIDGGSSASDVGNQVLTSNNSSQRVVNTTKTPPNTTVAHNNIPPFLTFNFIIKYE